MIALLSPHQPAATHATVAEVIKAVIALTSPNAFNPNGGNGTDPQVMTSPSGDTNANSNSESPTTNATGQFSNAGTSNSDNQPQQVSNPPPGQRDNRLVRELVMQDNIAILVSPMSQDPGHPDPLAAMRRAASPSSVMVDISLNGQDPQAEPETKASESEEPSYSFDPYTVSRRPSVASITSTFCQSITILIELIRKNNSDYSEPYLFHSIRNRLMGMQQRKVENRFHAKEESDRNTTETTSLEEDAQDRQEMEDAMAEMSGKLGIVHLGPLLASVSGRIEVLQNLISSPRHLVSKVRTRVAICLNVQ
jgi:SIT4-associating protein SAP185/190